MVNAKSLKQVNNTLHINASENKILDLPTNSTCLVVIINAYNVGSCWIVQTGYAAQQALINTIFETSYFKATATGRSQITITSDSATGDCYVWQLGTLLF